ncbi:D-tagatose-1,6-bisphosphate aldolase subunit KbaZ [Commensalibacter sp. Nvir]|uniref:D-tagatose-bisphosphate aldolase, class II, non-catalytic subunit n=1 Tax=Commensalibacter sp. Nvir TaxID=3069817 RepID=UPI002D6989C9|nr:D-tagatose-1,6-bisphosphate aldolase subunit KbaZ [Commensalibacter sp. Nvir]
MMQPIGIANTLLLSIVKENREGHACGIYSVCSAHPLVIEAALEYAKHANSPLLIEATCNQVNHLGGYTGMKPQDYYQYVVGMAKSKNFPMDKLILGGDHLGPNPWRHLPVKEAMEQAKKMVVAYVEAGFSKIHLDASMSCLGDQEPLTDETIADRAAELCKVAEEAALKVGSSPLYIIGTEVPVPGGEVSRGEKTSLKDRIVVTQKDAVKKTLSAHCSAFEKYGLKQAWNRTIGIVTQPGVDFDDQHVLDYSPQKASQLSSCILTVPRFVFEAHSTDYQTQTSLSCLVKDHFAILKVGPELTFAFREALFSLSYIEDILYERKDRSQIRDVIETVMVQNPQYWQDYYKGDSSEQKIARFYSYSDRIRYYWPEPKIVSAYNCLIKNIRNKLPSETLLSQFLPEVYHACRAGQLEKDPEVWLKYKVGLVLKKYSKACSLN